MSSAACYTNKLRVTTEANNTKVEYPGKVGKNFNPLYSTLGCNPRFTVLSYTKAKCDKLCTN